MKVVKLYLIEVMESKDNTLGIIVEGNLSNPKITVINQRTEHMIKIGKALRN